MSSIIKIITLASFLIIYINCNAKCNKETILPPSSKYHCSGLIIENMTNSGDTHCCLWKYIDQGNKETTRCSSISQIQFDTLSQYIQKKRNNSNYNYTQLEIECTKDQKLYCSNVVLDEEDIKNCSELKISIEDDKFCCRWKFKDSKNHHKNNNYCASINEFEYLNIKSYVTYKENHPDQRYDELSIDCVNKFLKRKELLNLLFLIIL
jgi:hypothetical protein